MMFQFQGKLPRSALFFLANVLGLGLIYLFLVAPVTGVLADRSETIRSESELLAHYEAVVKGKPLVDSMIAKMKEEAQRSEFLTGANEGAINANLQARLKTAVLSAGGQLRSVQTLPSRVVAQAQFAGAHIEISGSVRSIQASLYAVENSQPLLFIVSGSMTLAPTSVQLGTAGESLIEGQFDIYGPVREAVAGE